MVGYEIAASEPVAGDDPRGGRTARAAVTRALEGVDPALVHRVRLAPSDVAHVEEAARAAGLVVVADPRLRPGDAEAELATGLVDARLATALDRAREALLDAAAVPDADASTVLDATGTPYAAGAPHGPGTAVPGATIALGEVAS